MKVLAESLPAILLFTAYILGMAIIVVKSVKHLNENDEQ